MATDGKDITNTTVRVPREMHDKLRVIAAREQRSISGEVRRLIEKRIAEAESAEATA